MSRRLISIRWRFGSYLAHALRESTQIRSKWADLIALRPVSKLH